MTSVLRGALGAAATGVLLLAAQTASAQAVNGCPAGQAMQSSDPSGRNITCVPIPNVSGLQGQISAETAARQAADTQLQNSLNAEAGARQAADTGLQTKIDAEAASRLGMDAVLLQSIQQESADRKAADDALRSADAVLLQSIQQESAERKAADDALRNAGAESSIVGTYAFTGTVLCLTSSNNFTTDLTPTAPVLDGPSTVTTIFNGTSSGIRTFNADGTGTLQVTTHTVTSPSMFFSFRTITTFVNGVPTLTPSASSGIGFNGTGPAPSGGATTADQQATFTWQIVDGNKLIVDDGDVTGTITNGPASRIGASIRQTGAPRQVGVLGKDLRTIALTNENIQVETSTTTLTNGTVLTPLPRICQRERILRKL